MRRHCSRRSRVSLDRRRQSDACIHVTVTVRHVDVTTATSARLTGTTFTSVAHPNGDMRAHRNADIDPPLPTGSTRAIQDTDVSAAENAAVHATSADSRPSARHMTVATGARAMRGRHVVRSDRRTVARHEEEVAPPTSTNSCWTCRPKTSTSGSTAMTSPRPRHPGAA